MTLHILQVSWLVAIQMCCPRLYTEVEKAHSPSDYRPAAMYGPLNYQCHGLHDCHMTVTLQVVLYMYKNTNGICMY